MESLRKFFSDNGGYFVAADKELQELGKKLSQSCIIKSAANCGIKLHFNPSLSSYFGGAREIMIKAPKHALKAILTDASVSDEELMNAITGVESLLNSRPLTYQAANMDDDVPVTPNHFLHGQIYGHMGVSFAPETVDQRTFSPRKRWRRLQELVKHFWQHWLTEFPPGLNPMPKWHKWKRNLKVRNTVIVISPDCPRAQ